MLTFSSILSESIILLVELFYTFFGWITSKERPFMSGCEIFWISSFYAPPDASEIFMYFGSTIFMGFSWLKSTEREQSNLLRGLTLSEISPSRIESLRYYPFPGTASSIIFAEHIPIFLRSAGGGKSSSTFQTWEDRPLFELDLFRILNCITCFGGCLVWNSLYCFGGRFYRYNPIAELSELPLFHFDPCNTVVSFSCKKDDFCDPEFTFA